MFDEVERFSKIVFMKTKIALAALLISASSLYGQERVELLPFGNMDRWIVREIKESGVIGGDTKYLYDIGAGSDTIRGNVPYTSKNSPWAT